ncbi:MAG: TlpA family protein disulfide reductase [Thermomicrobiales bacterium]
MATADIPPPAPENDNPGSAPAKLQPSIMEQRWPRLALVLVIALGIVGITWTIGQKQGWSSIGTGGVNAQLLPKVGEPAPDLFTVTADGQPVLLSSLRGHPVWLNFWGSWCAPCQVEMPALEAAYKELQPQGLVMLGISQKEDVSASVAYANDAGATFPILVDPSRGWGDINEADLPPELVQIAKDTKSWQVNNYPTHIFIDSNGIVQAVVIKPMTEDEAVGYGNKILSVPYTGPALPVASPAASPIASPVASPVATPEA